MSARSLSSPMTIDRFLRIYGAIFEDSPWVAARAWERGPFASTDALHAAMVEEVERATPAEQLAILRAHPDLGGRGQMTTASAGEQSAAGLDALSPTEFARLADLNTAYRTKFGFPFILAVKGAKSRDIIAALERRFANSPDEEFREALHQVYRIARFRLEST
jgi:2-oxo-4-hydroxy-4-carboxy-5-ureidoimidazoline decarboxylase